MSDTMTTWATLLLVVIGGGNIGFWIGELTCILLRRIGWLPKHETIVRIVVYDAKEDEK